MATMLEKYATATVPRYTSYPPAPHFRAGFPATTYRDWLSALDPARPLSLYTRAFCRQLCSYCGCNMKLASLERALHHEPDLLFIERLTHELIDRCRRHGWSGKAGLGIERGAPYAPSRTGLLVIAPGGTAQMRGAGARAAHASLIARQMGKACVVSCAGLVIDAAAHRAEIGGVPLVEGDWASIDGDTGEVFLGQLEIATEQPEAMLAEVEAWREEAAKHHGRTALSERFQSLSCFSVPSRQDREQA